MQLEGKLDKFDFADVLQMLGSSSRSGKLTVTQYGGRGLVVLRRGKIIYAATSSARETLGNMLLCQGLISEEALERGLELQREAQDERRLGTILVDLDLLPRETLESIIAEQVEKAIAEFLSWNNGFFRFEELDFPDRGEVEVDATDMLLDEGLPADQVLLNFFHKFDRQSGLEARVEAKDQSLGELLETHMTPQKTVSATRSGSLKTVMAELHSPEFTSEITLGLLKYCQGIVRRGALFGVSRLGLAGMGQFGIEGAEGSSPDSIRSILMPLDHPSILKDAIARKSVYRGPLAETAANRLLLRRLGGGWPENVVVAPLIVHGRALLIFYGDNLPENDVIGPVDEFEVVLVHAGLAMEKNFLEKRVRYLEGLRKLA